MLPRPFLNSRTENIGTPQSFHSRPLAIDTMPPTTSSGPLGNVNGSEDSTGESQPENGVTTRHDKPYFEYRPLDEIPEWWGYNGFTPSKYSRYGHGRL